MEKGSALYQLMDVRMHSVMNGIVNSDGEYQAILRKSDMFWYTKVVTIGSDKV